MYRFHRASLRYRVTVKFWGDAAARPVLRDLNRDRKVEFVGRDDRFSGALTGYSASFFPLRIWSYRQGRFRDVTRSFPAELRADAARIARFVPSRGTDARGAGGAWAAEQALLGRVAAARTQMDTWAQRGFFDGEPNTAFSPTPVGAAYVDAVWQQLRTLGYLR